MVGSNSTSDANLKFGAFTLLPEREYISFGDDFLHFCESRTFAAQEKDLLVVCLFI